MSLIDDALKRAQAAHDAARESADRPWTPPPLPDARRMARSRTRWTFGFGVMIVLLGAAVLIFRSARSARPAPPLSSSARVPAPTSALPAIRSEVSVGPPPRGVAAQERAGQARASTVPEAAVSQGARTAPSVTAPAVPALSSTPRTKTGDAHPHSSGAEPRSYAGEMPLPGGAKITLDGIAFSDTSPVAVLNGRVLPPGGFIEGYTVSQIHPDRVELEREGTRVLLTLR